VLDTARRTDPDVAAAWQSRMAFRLQAARRFVRLLVEEESLADGWTEADAADFVWAITSIRTWEDLVVARKWSSAKYERHLREAIVSALVRTERA
jgi:hypothetical protein